MFVAVTLTLQANTLPARREVVHPVSVKLVNFTAEARAGTAEAVIESPTAGWVGGLKLA